MKTLSNVIESGKSSFNKEKYLQDATKMHHKATNRGGEDMV